MPEIHLGILVIEDCILYNLPNIKGYVLDNGIVEQGALGCHFTHISRRNETRCDEVMPYLANIGQIFGLEVHNLPSLLNFYSSCPLVNILKTSG